MNDNQEQGAPSTPATSEILKAPFPWFGGKSKVAPQVWTALGDVDNYVEPFAGSLAVLFGRPGTHTGATETVNDLDMYISNFWRAVSADPDAVAHYTDWPVNEADLFSRHLWLVNVGRQSMVAGLESDPEWYDARIAGWWVWGLCCWIGSGWCIGTGPHTYASLGLTGDDADAGMGVNRQLPHLRNAGRGVNRQLPHLKNAGMGVKRQRPHLGNAGMGVNRATNGSLYDYMTALAERLRRVRVCCGDWSRVVTHGALNHGATVGIFLDPPYSDQAGRNADLYSTDSLDVAHEVREWAIANGDNPRYRIVLAGYDTEHEMPDTWSAIAWRATGGYARNVNGAVKNRERERLWLSPHCLGDSRQNGRPNLFGD